MLQLHSPNNNFWLLTAVSAGALKVIELQFSSHYEHHFKVCPSGTNIFGIQHNAATFLQIAYSKQKQSIPH